MEVTTYAYTAVGSRASVTMPNGTQTAYACDLVGNRLSVLGEPRGAEVADADEDDGLESAGAEVFEDAVAEVVDVVAESARTVLTEAGEVLAELGGLDRE